MEISVGPISLNRDKQDLLEFYEIVAQSKADNVFIGEVGCHKRCFIQPRDFMDITQYLRDSGKRVYIATPAIVTRNLEFHDFESYIVNCDGIEINNIGFLQYIQKSHKFEHPLQLVAGPFLNIYNWKTANYLSQIGIHKFVMPHELPMTTVRDIIMKTSIDVEVIAFGHLTTALSWRCFTARAIGLTNETCGIACLKNTQGMVIKEIENGKPIFIIDGRQVLSAKTHCLIEKIEEIKDVGVSSIRIYAQKDDTIDIVKTFREVIKKTISLEDAIKALSCHAPFGFCNGWAFGKSGLHYVS